MRTKKSEGNSLKEKAESRNEKMQTRKSRNTKRKCDCHIIKETTAKNKNRNKIKAVNKRNPSLNICNASCKKTPYSAVSHLLTNSQSEISANQYRKCEGKFENGNFYIQPSKDFTSAKGNSHPYLYILYPVKKLILLKEIQKFDVAKKISQNTDKISRIISVSSIETKPEKPSNSFLHMNEESPDNNSSKLALFQPQLLTSSQFQTSFLGKYEGTESHQVNPLSIRQISYKNDIYININRCKEKETKFKNKTFTHLNENFLEPYSHQVPYMQPPTYLKFSSDIPDKTDEQMRSYIDFEKKDTHFSTPFSIYNKVMSEDNNSYTHYFFPYLNAVKVESVDQYQHESLEVPYISDNLQPFRYQESKNYYERFTYSPSGYGNKFLLDYDSFLETFNSTHIEPPVIHNSNSLPSESSLCNISNIIFQSLQILNHQYNF